MSLFSDEEDTLQSSVKNKFNESNDTHFDLKTDPLSSSSTSSSDIISSATINDNQEITIEKEVDKNQGQEQPQPSQHESGNENEGKGQTVDNLFDNMNEEEEENKLNSLTYNNEQTEILSKISEIFKQRMNMQVVEQKPQKKKEDFNDAVKIKVKKEDYGLNLLKLKKWSDARILAHSNDEEYKQEVALVKVRKFMDAISKVIKLQSWYRMSCQRRKFSAYKEEKRVIKRIYYIAWKQHWAAEHMYFNIIIGVFAFIFFVISSSFIFF